MIGDFWIFERVFLCSPDVFGNDFVGQAGLEFTEIYLLSVGI